MPSKPERTRFVLSRVTMVVIGLACICAPSGVRAQVRPEMYPIETVTLSTQQVLTGDKNGKSALLAGELRIPPATGRVPAVILVHGSGGLGLSVERWAQEINGIGVAAFLLDSFSGRGITSTVDDQSQLDSLAMMVDAYRALGVLAKHSRIDANRIAIMGFSKGAVAAVYSSNERFRKLYAPVNARFAAHIGLYTPCNVAYHDDDKLTGAPLRLFHGIADDYVAIGPCRSYVDRLKKAGADITLTEYAGAHHAYDGSFRGTEPVALPQAVTTRNCELEEGERGVILNSKTKKAYDANKDSCVERGTHVGYNEAATVATTQAVREFLASQFRLKP